MTSTINFNFGARSKASISIGVVAPLARLEVFFQNHAMNKETTVMESFKASWTFDDWITTAAATDNQNKSDFMRQAIAKEILLRCPQAKSAMLKLMVGAFVIWLPILSIQPGIEMRRPKSNRRSVCQSFNLRSGRKVEVAA